MAKKKDSIDHSGAEGAKNGSDADPDFSDPEGFVDDITDEGKLRFHFLSILDRIALNYYF